MPRYKKLTGEKLTVEIHKLNVVKELSAKNGETLKGYINRLIRRDMMKAPERLSNSYFKDLSE